jgi:hypothetical protein
VSVSTKGQEKKNTECRQYAIERFHGSLRYGPGPRNLCKLHALWRPGTFSV